MSDWTRRDWLALAPKSVASAAMIGSVGLSNAVADDRPKNEPFGYCLNTSTISGQKLSLEDEIDIAAKSGYTAIEPWLRELDQFAASGKSLEDLGKRIRDKGLTVESAIGFFDWAVDDDARRKKGFEQAKRDMDSVRRIGGTRIAAPPSGATDRSDMDLRKIAVRYHELLKVGDEIGVVPQVEVWGFSKTLTTLAEAAMVAVAADHPKACILADIFHLYKGGSGFEGFRVLNGAQMHVLHCNDYPASPPRNEINDALRVFPGDGVAPLSSLFKTLRDIGFRGYLSLELFNRDYWKSDAMTLAKTGLEKMKSAVKTALATA